MQALDLHTRHALIWAVLCAADGSQAEALLLPAELRETSAGADLSTLPAERVQRRPAPKEADRGS